MAKNREYKQCDICGQRFMNYFGSEKDGECLCKECNEVVSEEYERTYYGNEEEKE